MTNYNERLDEQIEKVIELSHRAGFLQGSGLSFIEDKGKSYNEAKKAMQALIATQVKEARISENKIFLKFTIGKPANSLIEVKELAQRANNRIAYLRSTK